MNELEPTVVNQRTLPTTKSKLEELEHRICEAEQVITSCMIELRNIRETYQGRTVLTRTQRRG